MNDPSAAPSHLRLVPPLPPDPRAAWMHLAERDSRGFIARHGHALPDPSLVAWVLEECAELAWERDQRGGWEALRVAELWLRLGSMHRFFPLPRLVVAYYETLRAFFPWLVLHGRLAREHGVHMLAELERAGTPMLERAREQLRQRHSVRSPR
jgi:hypothetical protein